MLLELVVVGEAIRRKQCSGIWTELWDIALEGRSLGRGLRCVETRITPARSVTRRFPVPL
jgi:hypothetical protein